MVTILATTTEELLEGIWQESGVRVDVTPFTRNQVSLEALLESSPQDLFLTLELLGVSQSEIQYVMQAISGKRQYQQSLNCPKNGMTHMDVDGPEKEIIAKPVTVPYTGLVNQGATCYLNSLLQMYFHLSAFRKAVYSMPTEEYTVTDYLPLALQRLFYQLSHQLGSCSTKVITSALGFTGTQLSQQQDVEEINSTVCDALEQVEKTVLQGSTSKFNIQTLFTGRCTEKVHCSAVGYTATHEDSFRAIPLKIRNCKDVYASLNHFLSEQIVDDVEIEHDGQTSKQTAQKTTSFCALPPILLLHLERFAYDQSTNKMEKVLDDYQFPIELDMSKYLESGVADEDDQLYRLHTVFVHEGTSTGHGHYVCFMNSRAGVWVKFNDETVQVTGEKEAVSNNFSGRSSAYMLAYVRASLWGIVADDGDCMSDIPQGLLCRFLRYDLDELVSTEEPISRSNCETEQDRERAKLSKQMNCITEMHIQPVTQADMTHHPGPWGLLSPSTLGASQRWILKRSSTLADLQSHVWSTLDHGPNTYRLWRYSTIRGTAFVPTNLICEADDTPLVALMPEIPSNQLAEHSLTLFLEEVPDGHVEFDKSDFLLSLKLYDPIKQTVRYIGSQCINHLVTLELMLPWAAKLMNVPADAELRVWHEQAFGKIVDLDLSKTVEANGLQSGDILVFQGPTEKAEGQGPLDGRKFMEYTATRVSVAFACLATPEDTCVLQLAEPMTYLEVQAALVDKGVVKGSQHYIQLLPSSAGGSIPFPCSRCLTLGDMLNRCGTGKIYYRLLEKPVANKQITMTCSYVDPTSSISEKMTIRIPEYSTLKDFVKEAQFAKSESRDLLLASMESNVLSELIQPSLKNFPESRVQYHLQPDPPYAPDAWDKQDLFVVCVAQSLENVRLCPDFAPFLWRVHHQTKGSDLLHDLSQHLSKFTQAHLEGYKPYLMCMDGTMLPLMDDLVCHTASSSNGSEMYSNDSVFWGRTLVLAQKGSGGSSLLAKSTATISSMLSGAGNAVHGATKVLNSATKAISRTKKPNSEKSNSPTTPLDLPFHGGGAGGGAMSVVTKGLSPKKGPPPPEGHHVPCHATLTATRWVPGPRK